MSFFDQLQPASFGGVPFGVLTGEGRFGRRQAIHEYPFRDKPWVEDLGKAARRINVTAFLIEDSAIYGGGDVIAQRDTLIAAAESAGTATLIHPTYGSLDVNLLEMAVVEQWDQARYFQVTFSFIESGQRVFPGIETATADAVESSSLLSDLASAADFVLGVVSLIHQGEAIIQTAIRTVEMWVAIAENVVNDATNLFGMVTTLPGQFGRYFGGASAGFKKSKNTSAPPARANASSSSIASAGGTGFTASGNATGTAQAIALTALIDAGSVSRAKVVQAAAALNVAVASGVPSAIATAVQALAATVLAATVDPADGVRLTASLAAFVPNEWTTSSVIGTAMSSMQTSIGKLCRRAAVVALARASARYQPSSADDAVRVRRAVTALLDAEIEIAGDDGEDSTYGALRVLRQAVVADLNARGAALPALKTFGFQSSLPAVSLALRLYREAGRGDEIVGETSAPHPAFQPRTIRVLAK